MHEHVVQVPGVRRLVSRRGKPRQALFVHICSQGADAVEQDIYAKIELQAIYQVWVLDVPLRNNVLMGWKVVRATRQVYSPPLALALGFDDEYGQLPPLLRRCR